MNLTRLCPLRAWVLAVAVMLSASACGESVRPQEGATPLPAPPAGREAGPSSALNAALPGEPQAEPPTFHSLGVRWPVRGDANTNAWVAVHYRTRNDAEWRQALPLFRTNPRAVSPENRIEGGWLFAGSIVDLTPDTEYEVVLSLRDPDGGDVQRVLTMRTIGEPRPPADMRVRHVVPAADTSRGPGTGTAADPFRGLKVAQAAAEPGDLFLLRAGVYAEGTWEVDRHGMPGRPIIYRGPEDGEAILDGGGGSRLVSASNVRHVWFERLTFRGARFLFVGHSGSHFVIRRSRFEVVGTGITAINGGYQESRGFVITDNVFQGPTSWPRQRNIEDINGVIITGAGHVVAYNAMRNLGDAVHGSEHGGLSASDIHNNDIDTATDDGIEADYSDTNVRVFRNRIANVYSGISAQPANGGPLYLYRNAMYNLVYSPFKLHNDTSGILILHNSSVKTGIAFHIDPAGETVNEVITRNNVFIGTGSPALLSTGQMIHCDLDSDGYGWSDGLGALSLLSVFAEWNKHTYASPAAAQRSGALYRQRGAIVLSLKGNFVGGLGPPDDARTRYPAARVDLRLEPTSRAVNAGVALPNFNDGFDGIAPDLGCCELGQPLPRYGPRP